MDPGVFREYSTHAVSNLKDLNWDCNVSEPMPNIAADPPQMKSPRRRGPPSLFHMVAEVAAKNIEKFDLQYLESIRPELIMLLHEKLGSLPGSISLHAWKAFHKASQIRELNSKSGKAVNKKSMVSRRFYHHISLPTADSLTTYIRPLQPSSSFDFLSHVRIAGPCQIKTEELLLLTNLKNLGVLEIIAPAHELDAFPDVSDRILRSWSEAEDPFPRLVVLKIHAHRHLSERSLRYLGRFPALAVFDIAGRSGEWEQAERLAAETGWMYCDLDMLIDLPYSPDYSSREIPLTSCARATEQFSDPARFRGLDPGCWACWALVVVQMKPLSVSEDAREAWAAWAPDCSPLEVPFASLTLGPDRQALDMPARPILGITQIVFWRRSLFEAVVAPEDSAGPGETVTSLAKKARKGTSDQPTSGGQPKKRRQVGSIADVLSSFQS